MPVEQLLSFLFLVRKPLDPTLSHESVVKKYGDMGRHMVILRGLQLDLSGRSVISWS
jgi:hypothetical protein